MIILDHSKCEQIEQSWIHIVSINCGMSIGENFHPLSLLASNSNFHNIPKNWSFFYSVCSAYGTEKVGFEGILSFIHKDAFKISAIYSFVCLFIKFILPPISQEVIYEITSVHVFFPTIGDHFLRKAITIASVRNSFVSFIVICYFNPWLCLQLAVLMSFLPSLFDNDTRGYRILWTIYLLLFLFSS